MKINKEIQESQKYTKLITLISIVVPVLVAVLFTVRIPNVASFDFLPPIYATINALTSVILIIAYIAIRNKKIKLHERLMKIAIGLSLAFLAMYVAYHMTSDSTPYGGQGMIRVRARLFSLPVSAQNAEKERQRCGGRRRACVRTNCHRL